MTAEYSKIAMRNCALAAFSVAIAIGPAAAGKLGVGAQAGGIGIGTSVGVGQKGASIGIGASLGGLNGGVSAAAGGGAPSVSGAAGAAPGGSPARSAAASSPGASGTAASTTRVALTEDVRQSIALPRVLWPVRSGRSSNISSFEAIPGTPVALVRACREAIKSAATPFGVVSVRVKSAGSPSRLSQGAVSAPVQVRIRYARQGGAEIRQARIMCHLDATGTVIRLT